MGMEGLAQDLLKASEKDKKTIDERHTSSIFSRSWKVLDRKRQLIALPL